MHLQILSSRFNVPMGQINHTNQCVEVPLPQHLCRSYYYDPSCLREPLSNLAMLCILRVMILAIILEASRDAI